jgi:O-antigen/teichoic acid export membrane protein
VSVLKKEFKASLFRGGSEAIWVLGGQVGVALGGLISVKILTHLLSPYEYGRFSIANTVIVLIGANIFGPLGQGLMRYWAFVQNTRALDEYCRISGNYIRRLIYVSVLLAGLFGLLLFSIHRHSWIVIIVLSFLAGAFFGCASIRLSILMAARKRKHVSAINVLTAFAKPVVAGILVIYWVSRAEIAVLGFLIVACASAWVAVRFFRRITEKRRPQLFDSGNAVDNGFGNAILKFSKPFFIWGIFAWAHQSCDRWALLAFQGADTVGAYSVVAQLAFYPLVFASGFLSNFFIPIAYQRAGGLQSEASISSANKVLVAMVLLYVTGALMLIMTFYLFHHQLVLLISNEEYAHYSYLLPMLTAAWSLYYLGQMLSGFGMLINKPNLYIRPILASGTLATIMAFSLAFKFSVIGVTFALSITGIIYTTWCLIIAKRLISTPQETWR